MINFAEIFFNAADNHLARTVEPLDMGDCKFYHEPIDNTEDRSVFSCDAIGESIDNTEDRPAFSCDAIDESIDKITKANGYSFYEDYWKLSRIAKQYLYSFGLDPDTFSGFKEFDAIKDRQDVRCSWLYLLGTVAEEENLWYDPDTAQLMEKIGEDYRPYQITSQSDCSCDENP